MYKRWVLVTGANKGIGFEIVRQLAFKGFSVVMTGRQQTRLDQAAGLLRGEGHDILTLTLDVTDQRSIDSAVETLQKQGIKLHALVNNAGILIDRGIPIQELTREIMRETFETNTFAPFFVSLAFDSCLVDNARIVMMSSSLAALTDSTYTDSPVYATSKTALNALTRQLAYYFTQRNIVVNTVSPGWVKTEMGGINASREVGEGAETPVWLATEVPLDKTGLFWRDLAEIPW